MSPQAPEEGLDRIKVSPNYLELSKKCREALVAESQRCGKELTKLLAGTFIEMKAKYFQGNGIVLNVATLMQAAISFWEDILRVTAYHPINRADKAKKAACIFKWITKMRPVKPFNDHTEKLKKTEINANALFAFLCACDYLNCRKALPEEELHRIIYSAVYRDIPPDEWTIIFDYLERIYPVRATGYMPPRYKK